MDQFAIIPQCKLKILVVLISGIIFSSTQSFSKTNLDSLFHVANGISQPKQMDSFLQAYCLESNSVEADEVKQLFDFVLKKYATVHADVQTLSAVHNKFIHLMIDKGFLDVAEKLCNQSLTSLKNESCENASIYLALSKIYSYRGDFKTAIDKAFKAVHVLEQKNSCVKELHNAYRYLSIHYAEIRDLTKSREFAEKAFEAVKNTTDTNLIASGIICVMDNYVHELNYEKASVFIPMYKNIEQGVTDDYYNATMYNLSGSVLVGQNKIKEGIAMYEKSIAANQILNDEVTVMYLYCNIGRAQRMANLHEASLQSFQKGLASATKLNIAADKLIALDGIAYAYKFLGKTELALKTREWAFEFMKDTLKEESLANATRELDAKYQLQDKNNKILLLEKDNKLKQRNIQFRNVLILLGLLSLGFAYVLFRRMKLQKDLEKQKSLEQERNRIASELHDDLGSNVTAIKMLSDLATFKNQDSLKGNELEKISNNATKLISNMSDIIWAMNTNNDSLQNLQLYIKKYAEDYLTENDISLNVTFHSPNKNFHIEGAKRRNLVLAVKECLHNIVKHADASEVEINTKLISKQFHIIIKDNGKGIDLGKITAFENGLRNMKNRMKNIGGSFEVRNENGTIILMIIPIE